MVIQSQGGSVDSNDISNSLNNGEIFKSLSVENDSGEVTSISSSLLVFDMKTRVNNFEGADVLILVGFVGE
jgi:hypothetical protein